MYKTFFKPYPEIESERLVLKMISYKDVKDVFEIYSDEDVCKFSDIVRHTDIFNSIEYIFYLKWKFKHNNCFTFGVYLQNTKRLIGTVSVTELSADYNYAEIGYSFNKYYRRQHYGSEAVNAFCSYMFSHLPVKEITAKVLPDNKASKKLLIKNGFYSLGIIKEGGYWHGQAVDVEMFKLTKKANQA